MNRDSGPSFSLEISQLESIKESQEVVNFVLGDFDYEFDGFDENRSKHRNDPQTMKKLQQNMLRRTRKKKVVLRKEDPTVLQVKLPPKEEELSKKFVEMSFLRLMASPRQKFSMKKQLYRLGGIPQVLNVWMFELCSNVDSKVTVKEVPSSIENPDQRSYRVNLPQVTEDRPTSTDSLVKETDKPVEMEEDKANQAPSHFKNGEQHDDGIEKQSDIVVEEMQSLDSIIPVDCYNIYFNLLQFEQHLDVIMYYLRKKYKNKNFSITRYTTTNCFFKVYIDKAYVNYYNADVAKDLATQDESASTDEVTDIEMSVINTIKGLSTRTTVYAEYLSEGLGIPYSGIDAQYHRLRYATLLCKSGSKKAENDYFSKNDDPPRPRSKFAPK
ncbi:hypothetical protein FXO38_07441 [Capsicum annuum]|nr:hypothetical protein FXO38_07441 [Capsicum annuum]